MTTSCRVTDCADPTDLFLCGRHTSRLRAMLVGSDSVLSVATLLAELDVTISRQDVIERASVRRRTEPDVPVEKSLSALRPSPWPFSWDASDVRWVLLNTVGTWARHIAEARGTVVGNVSPARWLADHLDSVRLDEAAGELFDEIQAAWLAAVRAVDRTTPDVFLGRCENVTVTTHTVGDTVVPEVAPCGTDLYVRDGADQATCGECGATYSVGAQHEKMLKLLPDVIAPTADIANGLTSLDQPVTPSMIRQMAFRREIMDRGSDPRSGVLLYRVGDVMDVLARRAEKVVNRSRRRAS